MQDMFELLIREIFCQVAWRSVYESRLTKRVEALINLHKIKKLAGSLLT